MKKNIFLLLFTLTLLFISCIRKEKKEVESIVVGDSIQNIVNSKSKDTLQINTKTILIKTDSFSENKDTVKVIVKDTIIKTYRPIFIEKKKLSLKEIYSSQLGVREATGKNDGKIVEMYLHSVGLNKGNPWCAAFVHWSLDSAGYKNNITGWSPTTFNPNNLIYFKNKFKKEPREGDVFSLYFPSLKRIAHTGFFDYKQNSSIYSTVEGNTNDANSREGDGVYRRYRSFNSTYSISRWTGN
jgi:hypothetical protein